MNTQPAITPLQFQEIINRLDKIEHLLQKQAGETEAWWSNADQAGLEAVKHGNYTKLKTPQEVSEYLDTL